MTQHRIYYMDAIRGLALFIMVFANCVPYLFQLPHAFAIRAIDSTAAPVFVALAGYGISRMLPGNAPAVHWKLLKRGLLTLLVAALMDALIWLIMPFTGYDVLYVLAFSIILVAFISKLPDFWLLALILVIITLSYYFQSKGYYRGELNDFPLELKNWREIYRNFDAGLIHGWFPLLPWLAIFLFGYLGGKKTIRFGRYKLIVSMALVLLCSLSLIIMYHDNKLVRSGYSELFYPADLTFLVFALALTALVWINRTFFNHKLFLPFRVLGRSSLFVYILHAALISFSLKMIFGMTGKNAILSLLILYALVYAGAVLLWYIKRHSSWKKMPYVMRFLFGS